MTLTWLSSQTIHLVFKKKKTFSRFWISVLPYFTCRKKKRWTLEAISDCVPVSTDHIKIPSWPTSLSQNWSTTLSGNLSAKNTFLQWFKPSLKTKYNHVTFSDPSVLAIPTHNSVSLSNSEAQTLQLCTFQPTTGMKLDHTSPWTTGSCFSEMLLFWCQ